MLKQCIVIGCGSHASSVISIIESSPINYEIIGLVDISENFDPNEKKSGYNVILTLRELLDCPNKYINLNCFIALGDNEKRKAIFDQLKAKGYKIPNLISGYALVDRTVTMGEGNVVGHAAIINAQVKIGRNNLINTGALIEHDCNIEDHVHISPRVTLCGNVSVSNLVFIGANSVIIPNLYIEKKSFVSAGAVLIKNILEESSVYIGAPARRKKS